MDKRGLFLLLNQLKYLAVFKLWIACSVDFKTVRLLFTNVPSAIKKTALISIHFSSLSLYDAIIYSMDSGEAHLVQNSSFTVLVVLFLHAS